jgi:hypothetical protein
MEKVKEDEAKNKPKKEIPKFKESADTPDYREPLKNWLQEALAKASKPFAIVGSGKKD